MERELTLRCDCGAHYLDLDVYIDEDSYVVFVSRFGENSWRSRLRAIWNIARGQQHLLNEVFLTPGDLDRLRMFLASNATYHVDFSSQTQSTS